MELAVSADGTAITATGIGESEVSASVGGIGFEVYESGRTLQQGATGVSEDAPKPGPGRSVIRDVLLRASPDAQPAVVASLRVEEQSGVFALFTSCDTPGDLSGDCHFRIEFDLPEMSRALALYMFSDWWSRPHFTTDTSTLPSRTQMLLWETEAGAYGCIVGLTHNKCVCQINSRSGRAGADLILHDSGHRQTEAYALAGGFGDDPFELVSRVVSEAMKLCGSPGRLRSQKQYPALQDEVGWCSWNAMYASVSESGILTKMREIAESGFPVRWVLIDDGWSPTQDGQLSGFGADEQKFPRGLRKLVNELKGLFGIRKVGVWHTFTGYWGGISSESDIYNQHREHIFSSKRNTRIPYPAESRGFGFWNAWHSYLRAQGVDFVKVDNQGATYHHTSQSIPAAESSRGQQYALQASVGVNFGGQVINCMCMSQENVWNWPASNIARNSDDFLPNNPEATCEHALQNVYNNIFSHNFAWPDWDMWFSYHVHANFHAAMRAVSGGPVYITDEVGKGDYSVLWPLVCSDGRLLRCDCAALPARDCLFGDPRQTGLALKAFNRSGGAGVVAALNASGPDVTARGALRPSDVEGLEGDTFAVREYFSDECRVLGRDEAWELEIEPFGARLFTVAPVRNSFGVIGLGNKYISAAGVCRASVGQRGAHVLLKDGGELVCYCEQEVQRVVCGGRDCGFRQEGGWLFAQILGKESCDVWISW